jgi:hypothetical protein
MTNSNASKMTKEQATAMLQRVRLELARCPEYPQGSHEHGYDFIAPLDAAGHIDAEAWKLLRDRCRVKRFWGDAPDEVGHIIHRPGGTWAFHYDIRGDAKHDDAGYHFDTHKLAPGEYISLKEQDGVLRTFFVRGVVAVD